METYNNQQKRGVCIPLSSDVKVCPHKWKMMPQVKSGLLHVTYMELNHINHLFYSTVGYESLFDVMKSRLFTDEDVCLIINQVIQVYECLWTYLLNPQDLVFDSKAIFINRSSLTLAMVYQPLERGEDQTNIKAWILDFLMQVNMSSSTSTLTQTMVKCLTSTSFCIEEIKQMIVSHFDDASLSKVLSADMLSHMEEKTPLEASYDQDKSNKVKRQTLLAGTICLLSLGIYIFLYQLMAKLTFNPNDARLGVFLLMLSLTIYTVFKVSPHMVQDMKRWGQVQVKKKNRQETKIKAKVLTDSYQSQASEIKSGGQETSVLGSLVYTGAALIVSHSGEKWALSRGTTKIGRQLDRVDYVLPFAEVGRVHCEVTLLDQACLIKDLGSKNGTYVNGYQLESGKAYSLTHGDRVILADKELIYHDNMQRPGTLQP